MFAPDSERKRETVLMIPGRSGHEISRRRSSTRVFYRSGSLTFSFDSVAVNASGLAP